MKKFPVLKFNQVALLRAVKATGIVLDENFIADTSIKQRRFTVFESIEEAIAYINNTKVQRDNVEFVVYDYDQNALLHC